MVLLLISLISSDDDADTGGDHGDWDARAGVGLEYYTLEPFLALIRLGE